MKWDWEKQWRYLHLYIVIAPNEIGEGWNLMGTIHLSSTTPQQRTND